MRRLGVALAAALAVSATLLAPVARRVRTGWGARVAVTGESMRPTLRPGDWLLVDRAAPERHSAVGDLVVVPDPRDPERLLVKRVAGRDQDGGLIIVGDAADGSTDSRVFGAVSVDSVVGRPWFRYWPLRRVGRIR